ncbi:MAG TPA: hypothetical protein PLW81_02955 [Thiobacillaceae bacterium]|nr:hypothetical protein [Thiobacillaceae bacterium]
MTADERRLLRLFRALPETRRAGLLDYAEFLLARDRGSADSENIDTPLDIPRPARENVVKAIKRLTATYPMLDRGKLLHDTSALMTQHLVHGRSAGEVIDELEGVFRSHYEAHLQTRVPAEPLAPIRPAGENDGDSG